MKKNFMNGETECDSNEKCTIKKCDETDVRFYRCELCGQMMACIGEASPTLTCCSQSMKELIPCSTDGAHEKHVPVYHVDGHKVEVEIGEQPHPMTEEHYIEWICLVTCCGIQWHPLKPGDEPRTCFRIKKDEEVIAVYEYCNIHGLWKA